MTTAAVELALPVRETTRIPRRLPLLPVAELLEQQHQLTAVERFSELHDAGKVSNTERYYRDPIPLRQPKATEQYAFEVDLDACTGCKACVSGCHTLNGLDESEIWRTVGLMHGSSEHGPAIQTITTSCHHCLEPACLAGCPVKAYEKDPVTGIVKHLDDQCIGCQYCTMMCPYDAPKFNKALGIVRKCDMCSSRLQVGESPACVAACPNGAIVIRNVDKSAIIEAAQSKGLLPGAPTAEHTLPSTTYNTKHAMPANMLPADYYRTHPEHSHPPLVLMLTLTQLSVGAFIVSYCMDRLYPTGSGTTLHQTITACALALVALAASIFHLGRPWLAWRVFLGLRTSWLSREAIALGGFASLGMAYGGLTWASRLPFSGAKYAHAIAPGVQVSGAIVGLIGVLCSVMVYVATRRAHWAGVQTGIKFLGTMALLGSATVLTVHAIAIGRLDQVSTALLTLTTIVTIGKLGFEASVFAQLRNRRQTALKRVAALLTGELRQQTQARFLCAILGGIVLPLAVRCSAGKGTMIVLCGAAFLTLLAGEFLERYLFFRAAPASRMPGGLR